MDEIQRRWNQEIGRHYIFSSDYMLNELTPALKQYLLGLTGKKRENLVDVIHQIIDKVLVTHKSHMLGVTTSGSDIVREVTGTPIRIRRRRTGAIIAEISGKDFLLQENALRLKTELPESLAHSLIGKSIEEAIGSLGKFVDGKQKIIGHHKGMSGGTVLRLEKSQTESLSYRKLIGNPQDRFK